MLALVSAAVASEPGVVYGEAGVITPLTTVAARLAAKYGVPSATSNLLVALAFGGGRFCLSIHLYTPPPPCKERFYHLVCFFIVHDHD